MQQLPFQKIERLPTSFFTIDKPLYIELTVELCLNALDSSNAGFDFTLQETILYVYKYTCIITGSPLAFDFLVTCLMLRKTFSLLLNYF